MKAGSTVSRRVSEFVGVALFAAGAHLADSLATYEPTDPVWFFSAGSGAAPANFAGRVGAFTAELSFQLFGYASYLIPAVFVVVGWHYFWCRDARGGLYEARRRAADVRLHQLAAEPGVRQRGGVGQVVPRRRLSGEWLAA